MSQVANFLATMFRFFCGFIARKHYAFRELSAFGDLICGLTASSHHSRHVFILDVGHIVFMTVLVSNHFGLTELSGGSS